MCTMVMRRVLMAGGIRVGSVDDRTDHRSDTNKLRSARSDLV